jgi:hypothetical protein
MANFDYQKELEKFKEFKKIHPYCEGFKMLPESIIQKFINGEPRATKILRKRIDRNNDLIFALLSQVTG